MHGLRRRWRWLAAYAILEVSIPFPLIAAGEQHISSSLAAIIIATVPLNVALLALRFDRAERASGTRLIGLCTGLLGVIVLVGVDAAGDNLRTRSQAPAGAGRATDRRGRRRRRRPLTRRSEQAHLQGRSL